MFEIYTKKVRITTAVGDAEYAFRPLSGRFLPKLYRVLKQCGPLLNGGDEKKDLSPSEVLEVLSEENVALLHELCFETLKKSYPNEDPKGLEEFVSQNLMQMFGALIEVNMGSGAKAS